MLNQTIIDYMEKLYNLNKNKRGNALKKDFTYYINEIFYVLKTGISWKNLRTELNNTTIFRMFQRLQAKNIFQLTFEKFIKIHQKINH